MSRYVRVDVFADGPYRGNQLAVFPDPGSVDPAVMQAIAREMNLSETTFVTRVDAQSYDVRIFTPAEELPFAGHPTLGTAWVLRSEGTVSVDRVVQRSEIGDTPVSIALDTVWFDRAADLGDDVDPEPIAKTLGIDVSSIGFDAAALGCERIMLRPATASIGSTLLLVPLADEAAVAGLQATPAMADLGYDSVYFFTATAPGRVKARFFAPSLGIAEDPATGLAAASLGTYIGDRAGELAFEIAQGDEVGRPSRIHVDTARGRVRVGGSVVPIGDGTLRTT